MDYLTVFTASVLLLGHFSCGDVMTPAEFAKLAGDQMLQHQPDLIRWFYGGAIVLDGLFRVNVTFLNQGMNYAPTVYRYLDQYASDPDAFGYKILHNITIPFFHNVGDQVGLFPINYLNRIIQKESSVMPDPSYDPKSDLTICQTDVDKYILGFPERLAGPTGNNAFVRNYGWPAEPNGTNTFLWCDDMYMGFTMLARFGAHMKRMDYVSNAACQITTFAFYLQTGDGTFAHGANAADNHQSCCKWGRANGWVIMAIVEVLEAMSKFEQLRDTSLYHDVLNIFQKLALGIVYHQDHMDGRWHQVLDKHETFLETSASAMALSALSRGVIHGFLREHSFMDSLKLGWMGLTRTISQNGTISGVCNGHGIGPDWQDYEKCDTAYLTSSDGGLGSVLYAAADYERYLEWRSKFIKYT